MSINSSVRDDGHKEPERKKRLRALRESDESLPICLERITEIHPSRTALLSDEWQLSYSELGQQQTDWRGRLSPVAAGRAAALRF